MLYKIKGQGIRLSFMLFFFAFFFSQISVAQIYKHEFGTTTITATNYEVNPTVFNSNLSSSSWTNSNGSFTSNPGASGQGLQIDTSTSNGSGIITLTFNVANGFAANITSFDFWRRKSNSGPRAWSIAINGTPVGSGAVTDTNATTVGLTTVTGQTGLTGTVTITITLTGGSGGWFRIDDFTLNGSVVSNCAAAVFSSISPATGPVNTVTKITGSNFTGATSVKFDGVAATYTVISDTEIQARIPAGTTAGAISITSSTGCVGLGAPAGTFTLIDSQCGAPEVFISEVYDQRRGNGGMIELFNPSNVRINFNGIYRMLRYANINDNTPAADYDLIIPDFIEPRSTYLISCTAPDSDICASPTANAYLGNGFNGNDKIELLKNNVVIDRVQVPFTGPGFTLIRNSDITSPTPTYNQNQWSNVQHSTGAPVPDNYCANLGIHTINNTVPTITHPQDLTVCEGSTATFTTAISGSGTYTYQWKVLNTAGSWVNVVNGANYSGATTATLTITNVPQSFNENQYYCHITSTECDINSNAAQLKISPIDAINVQFTPTDCATGMATVTVSTPTGNDITYKLDGAAQTSNIFPASPGLREVRAYRGNCYVSQTITVAPAPGGLDPLDAEVSQTDCATGRATITVNAPTGPGITYTIGTDIYTTPTFTLEPGSYTLTAANATCSVSGPILVGQAPPLANVDVEVSQTDCATGRATVTVNAPTGPGITYTIGTTTYTTTTFTLEPGSYTLRAVNGNCVSQGTVVVGQAPPLANVDVEVSQTDCATGRATVTVNAPTGPGITYTIGTTTYTTTTFTLEPGSYTLRAANGSCISQGPVLVGQAPPLANVDVEVSQTDCATGLATVTVNAPTGPGITYTIGTTTYTTTTFTLEPGSYTLRAANGSCISQGPVVVGQAPPLTAVNADVSQTDCITGRATVTVNAPTGPGIIYTIGTNTYTTTTFTIEPGSYTLRAANGSCTSSRTINVSAAPLLPRPTIAVVQPTCLNAFGSFSITPVAGYTYQVNGGTFTATTNYPNQPVASYTVVAKDANGCLSQPATFQLTTPVSPATPSAHIIPATCQDAFASIVVDSPRAPGYTYSIDGGLTWQPSFTFGGLLQGTYTITVRTSAMCTAQSIQYIIDAAPQTPAIPIAQLTPPDCAGNLGSLEIIPQPGTGFTYSLNGGPFTTDLIYNNLPSAQAYYVTVKNSDGCTERSITYRMIPSPVVPAEPVTALRQPDCSTDKGSITVSSPIGTQYTYSIDGVTFQPSRVFSNLDPDTYTIIVNNGQCTSTNIVTINNPPAPAPSPGTITGNNAVCIDDVLQLANTVTGGIWSSSNASIATVDANGLVTPKRTGSTTITYTVGTICTAFTQKIINVNAMPRPVLQDTYYVCKDATTGVNATITLHSGLSVNDYSFAWTKDGAAVATTSSYLNTNEPGYYEVTATNLVTGCSATAAATVKESSIASATAAVGVDFNFNQVITVTVTGGSGDYEYSLDGGRFQDEPYFTRIDEGEHEIMVKDKNNCGILILHVFSLNYPRFFSPNGDGVGETWNIKGLQNQRDAAIFIYDRFGKLIANIRPSGAGWDGTLNGHPLPATDYWFSVSYLSSNGVKSEFKAHFSLLR